MANQNNNNVNSRAKHWCFTLNNYTDDNIAVLRLLVQNNNNNDNDTKVTHVVFGYEVAPGTNTPHLQGFISFDKKLRRNQVLRIIPQCHLTPAQRIHASIEYCKKDGNFEEYGTRNENQGQRTDIEAFKKAVEDGCLDLETLYTQHSEVCAKYPSFVRSYLSLKAPKPEISAHELRPWQIDLNRLLINEPHPRHIIFIIDFAGNAGKTWFAQHYCSLHKNAQYILPGKKADMAHLLSFSVRVLFIDCPRSKQGEQIQYNFLEECKNGVVFASKYESVNKYFKKCTWSCSSMKSQMKRNCPKTGS
jgi:hypothetical protein